MKNNINYIRCYFHKDGTNKIQKESNEPVEIYYAETEKIEKWVTCLSKFVTKEELNRSERFFSKTYKKTYLSSHALLRLILSEKLGMNPSELSFYKGRNDKPELKNNEAYFNISHTHDSFTIAYAKNVPVGIDLEAIKTGINYKSIINIYFTQNERDYILKSERTEIDRFYLSWTRKEALLKAIGTGIINNLDQIGLSEPDNYIDRALFKDSCIKCNCLNEYFIYSTKIEKKFLSIAVPVRSPINFIELNEQNISFYV